MNDEDDDIYIYDHEIWKILPSVQVAFVTYITQYGNYILTNYTSNLQCNIQCATYIYYIFAQMPYTSGHTEPHCR